jgi:hypothetical protein
LAGDELERWRWTAADDDVGAEQRRQRLEGPTRGSPGVERVATLLCPCSNPGRPDLVHLIIPAAGWLRKQVDPNPLQT